jgi:hypothetical protein
MSIQLILLPVFVQIALTAGLGFWLVRARIGTFKRGEAKMAAVAASTEAWPQPVKNIGAAYDNQFQLPVLLYVLVILALITRKADFLFVIMEWIFIILRISQAYVHTTSNALIWRFRFFVTGAVLLTLMWVIFAVHILAAPAVGAL